MKTRNQIDAPLREGRTVIITGIVLSGPLLLILGVESLPTVHIPDLVLRDHSTIASAIKDHLENAVHRSRRALIPQCLISMIVHIEEVIAGVAVRSYPVHRHQS